MSATPNGRITGTEMEWGGMVVNPLKPDEQMQINAEYVMPHVVSVLKNQGISKLGTKASRSYFLSNGARFYQDIRERIEYCTPEDTTVEGTAANEIVNDTIMANVANSYHTSTGNRISFTKRVIDDEGTGCGYHINYSADAERVQISPEGLALFGIFAATRSVLFGAGALLRSGEFSLSQKALITNIGFTANTTHVKALVNTRNQPLADKSRFLRVHDTSADPNMSPWATRVKITAGSLTLKLIEEGRELENLRFSQDPAEVAREVARDVSLTKRFRLHNGSSVTALEAQQRILSHAQNLPNLTNEEMWAIEEWDRAICDIRKDRRLVVDRVEWAMKPEMLNRQHDKNGWSWDSEALRYKDRQFSEVAFDGIGVALREATWAKHMPSETLVKSRMQEPPLDTRANIRSYFIKGLVGRPQRKEARIHWHTISLGNIEKPLSNPYLSDYRVAQELFHEVSIL